jgi:NAD(P)-dependent dehydrogenase (short-subunit alcohol dehydrogenase family)
MNSNPFIFISGGTGKVGSALVKHFMQFSFNVCFTSTSISKANQLADEIHASYGRKPEFVICDFSQKNAVDELISSLDAKGIKLSQVIHNARSAKYLKINSDEIVDDDDFIGEFLVDVVFPYKLTMKLIGNNHPLIQVLFISSMYGVVGPTPSLYDNLEKSSFIHYGVCKAAQIHMTKELAVRLAKNKIHVNCITFGGIEGRVSDSFKDRYSNLNPLGEMLTESDVVPPVDFLIRNPGMKMTGHNLIIDGGWTIW